MLCPKCGSSMPDDGLFCGSCGYDIRKPVTEAVKIPESAPASDHSAFGRAMDLDEAPEISPAATETGAAKSEFTAPAESEGTDGLPVFSGRKRGVSKVYESPPAAVEPHREAETPVYTAPVSAPVYKPVMPPKPKFNWKKILAMVLVLALIVGGICWIVEADPFGGASTSRKDRDDDDDDRDDDDRDDDGGSHGSSSTPSNWQGYECSGLVIYLPGEFEVGYSYYDALYCYTDTYYVEVVCGPMSDVDSSIHDASDFADYYEYQISGYYEYERGTKNGVPYILTYDAYYDQTTVYGFFVYDGYGWMTASYCYGEGDAATLISYATHAEIDSSHVPEPTDSYDDYYDDEDDYDDDSYYEDDYYAEDYFDCSGCMNGRCGICMGDGDYAGVECKGCDGSGVCGLCDGLGIIFY